MIGAVVIDDIVENIIVLDKSQLSEMTAALGVEIVDAAPYGLAIGDLRTELGWTRNVEGEQVVLSMLEQEAYDGYTLAVKRADEAEERIMDEALAILSGAVE